MKKTIGTCQLCERTPLELTVHHLVPRELGGTFGDTALLCSSCHKQIHALYSNEELAIRLDSIPRLKDDPKLSSFIKYIRKQPASKKVPVKKAKNLRKK